MVISIIFSTLRWAEFLSPLPYIIPIMAFHVLLVLVTPRHKLVPSGVICGLMAISLWLVFKSHVSMQDIWISVWYAACHFFAFYYAGSQLKKASSSEKSLIKIYGSCFFGGGLCLIFIATFGIFGVAWRGVEMALGGGFLSYLLFIFASVPSALITPVYDVIAHGNWISAGVVFALPLFAGAHCLIGEGIQEGIKS